jgi:hypothetical protein
MTGAKGKEGSSTEKRGWMPKIKMREAVASWEVF